jgi:PKD repeat protein
VLPTAFRLTRRSNGSFFPDSFQPLPSGTDYTGAAWNPDDGRVYVGHSSTLRTYDYLTNSSGPSFSVSGLSGILGMTFAEGDLFVVSTAEKLFRVDWATKRLQPGWTFDLTPFNIKDSRGVDVIRDPGSGQDQFYVLDGYSRSSGDPLDSAVFVLDVCCGPAGPVASFTWAQDPGTTTVQFTDTSTGGPTAWSWNFGDSTVSTERNPSHTYLTAGSYNVTLTASSSAGSSSSTRTITIPPAPTASFTWAQDPGTTTVRFTDTSTGGPTAWEWDFGDSTSSTQRNPSHTYASVGTYTVTLTASNVTGSSTAIEAVTVSDDPPPPPPSDEVTFTSTADSFVSRAEPTKNFGTKVSMQGKVGSSNEKRPYVTFTVSDLQGQTISGATLRLFVTDASPFGGDWYSVAPTWIESGTGGITWNNAPPIAGSPIGSIANAPAGTWVELDVSGVVIQEGTYSFAMKTNVSDAVYYATKETSSDPQLVVALQ